MKKLINLYVITFVLAFCSIVYELILAQALSAFLENTVLRFSVTIGLYMFSLGIGAFLAEGKVVKRPIVNLVKVEIYLTIIGGFALVWLHLIDMAGFNRILFSIFSHMLIILIGILSGFEIPLLMELHNKYKENAENVILGVNYAGAFLGTVIFAFIFYPEVGLMPSALFVGSLNALAGIALYVQANQVSQEDQKDFYKALYSLAVVFLLIGLCVMFSNDINAYFMNQYLN